MEVLNILTLEENCNSEIISYRDSEGNKSYKEYFDRRFYAFL